MSEPTSMLDGPVRPAVTELTVMVFVAVALPQSFVTVYDIRTVPAASPFTVPVPSTVAMPVEPELQVPPGVQLESVIFAFTQTLPGPVIVPASGNGLILIITVAVLLQPLVVPVTVYTVVADGLAVTVAPVADDKPVDGDHE
jgi:hypothetical protein